MGGLKNGSFVAQDKPGVRPGAVETRTRGRLEAETV